MIELEKTYLLKEIPKSTNLVHLTENLGAIGWKIDKADLNRLDFEFEDPIASKNRRLFNS